MKKIRNHSLYLAGSRIPVWAMLMFILPLSVYAQEEIEKGRQIFDAGNLYGAERFFTEYVTKNPADARGYFYLGRVALENKKNDEAADFFDKAVSLDPDRAEYYTWTGINYITILGQVDFLRQGLYAPKALKALERSVALDSLNVLGRIYLAGYYSQAPGFAGGDIGKAVEQIDLAAMISPGSTGANFQRGLIQSMAGNYEEAKKSFEAVMTLDPSNYDAYLEMGKMCAENNVYPEQGEICLSRFISSAPEKYNENRDDAWWYLGNLYRRNGKNADARNAYEKAVSLDPQNEDYRKSLKNVM